MSTSYCAGKNFSEPIYFLKSVIFLQDKLNLKLPQAEYQPPGGYTKKEETKVKK